MRVASALLAVVSSLLLARLLGPAEFGVYAFWLAAGSVACLPALQGLPTLVVREVAGAAPESQATTSRKLLRFSDICSVAIVAAMCIAAAGWMWTHANWTSSLALPFGAIILQGFLILTLVRCAVLRGFRHDVLGQLPSEIVRPAALAVLALALWAAGEPRAQFALACNILATAIGFLVALALLAPVIRPLREGETSGGMQARDWLRSLLPLSTVSGMQLINGQVDLLALGLLANASEVGIFKVATTFAIQVNFGLNVVNAVAAPRFAVLYGKHDLVGLRSLNRVSALVALACGGLVFLVFLVAAAPLIAHTAGPSFLPAVAPLLILSLAHLATMWAGSTNVMLNMMRHERDVIVCAAACLVVNVLLNALFIPIWGVIGASIATASSLVVWRMSLLYFLRRRLAAI